MGNEKTNWETYGPLINIYILLFMAIITSLLSCVFERSTIEKKRMRKGEEVPEYQNESHRGFRPMYLSFVVWLAFFTGLLVFYTLSSRI
jgi:uncharacterized membrane protein (DUF106 family)